MSALRRYWWILPVALFIVGGTAGANGAGIGSNHSHVALGDLLSLLAVLTLLLQRWPPIAISSNAVIVAAYFAWGFADGPIYLTVPLVTFVIAYERPPREWWPWTTAAVLFIAIGQVVDAARGDQGWRQTIWQIIGEAAITAAAGAIATTLRSRREARSDRIQRTATEEQLRMAQDLHDGVGHRLAVIAMQAGVALHVLDREPQKARESLAAIRDESRQALDDLRAELARMADHSTPRRPLPGVEDLGALVDRVRASGLDIDLEVRSGDLPGAVDHGAYAVVQEALTNVLRHAHATSAAVFVIAEGDSLVVTVTDDGSTAGTVEQNAGMGIPGMRSRAEALGGTLEAGVTADGFRVQARLPLDIR